MEILSSNSDGDGDIRKISGMDLGQCSFKRTGLARFEHKAQSARCRLKIRELAARTRVALGKFCNCQGYLDASESSIPE
ncbi:hypothetical protein WN944_021104 [Citrus x changshan-huyou]|uniref:Uncharacterized protein n=1 Tax=Citrus x changshan-huyou TaxID=2935761 RepID=A0AAP0N0W7_9ROSI